MSVNTPTITASNRYFKLTSDATSLAGFPYVELGPAGTTSQVSTMMVQFTPNGAWSGSVVVMARMVGTAADNARTPFEPIPYRVGSLNNVAQITNGQGWPWSTDPIVGAAIIQIPANGMSIVLLAAPQAGQLEITAWDLQGPSAL